ncbi:MAG TPA: GNAT family N-acetyltransferase [Casimicrobiaceae bacterium]|nr:GNAT family N-acetyltransferase [Casimicrobiaceae bacterium]
MPIRPAQPDDLPTIVDIYNASIPGRLATADTEPVTVESRRAWFAEFDRERRPLWVLEEPAGELAGWLSLKSFYGRPAYHATVEIAVYCAAGCRRRGVGWRLVQHALASAPALGIRTILAFVFAHNTPSVNLFGKAGFDTWGMLPRVAELDGIERDLAIMGRRIA